MVPGFRQGRRGQLFTLEIRPARETPRGVVIHLPAFAEEMNKSRSQVARQGRALAAQGWLVVIPDLYGCGDSQGEFNDADWMLWLDDLVELVGAFQKDFGPPVLWGLRVGALLASQLLTRVSARGLILWQPVVQGQQFFGQFLRLRLAASMLSGESRETVSGLRETLHREGYLEVAGYRISQALGASLDAARLEPATSSLGVIWLEVVGAPDRDISPVSRKQLDRWRESGCDVQQRTVVGETFWSSQEIKIVPALVDATTEMLNDW